jgi:hypothetical protein
MPPVVNSCVKLFFGKADFRQLREKEKARKTRLNPLRKTSRGYDSVENI